MPSHRTFPTTWETRGKRLKDCCASGGDGWTWSHHALAPAEAGLAAGAPGFVRLGLVLAHLEHHEAIRIDQRGVGDVGDVEAAVHRLLDHAHGKRRQAGDVVGD